MKTIAVNASKAYDIHIGSGILEDAGSIIRGTVGGDAAAVVTDDNVAALYGERMIRSLENGRYRVARYVFKNGETAKNADTFVSILNFLAEEKLSRADVFVALGGGVAGDLAGFAAACYMRGIRYVQVPTTLLAAVDASVGGKTAINLPSGKNMAGAFYQPDAVLCDVALLSTLAESTFRDGCAEIVKYGVIADRVLFASLDAALHPRLAEVIARCLEIKSDIVSGDEFEHGARKLLNFGHTVGHGIESLSGYQITHGYAVAAGMAVAARAAYRMGICDESCPRAVLRMLKRHGLPVNTVYGAGALARACLSDKKRDGDSLTMVFPEEIGKCVLRQVPVHALESVIGLGLEELPDA